MTKGSDAKGYAIDEAPNSKKYKAEATRIVGHTQCDIVYYLICCIYEMINIFNRHQQLEPEIVSCLHTEQRAITVIYQPSIH